MYVFFIDMPQACLSVLYFHIFYAFCTHYLFIFYAIRPSIFIYIFFCIILLLLLRFIPLDLHFWARTKFAPTLKHTRQPKKKKPLSNPREIKRGKSSNLTNKLFCPILLLFFFEPGSQHRAISAKQSEYKWVEGADNGLEGEGICKSWNCQQTIKNAAAQKT